MAHAPASTLIRLSAVQLAKLIARGEVSSVEVTQAHIARIEEVNSKINAVVVRRFDQALREANEADARRARGEPLPPLHGVPITIKECLDLVGTPSTFGMPSRRSDIPQANDRYVQRLIECGAIVLGKTNVPQALIYNESSNALYGRTNNPWDATRTPGGSSGGEAAIIAASGSPLGLGTDIGGSLRLPAHFCGITSLKPTSLRTHDYSRFSDLAFEFGPITCVVGPMARDVADLALALRLIGALSHPRLPSPQPLGDPAAVDVSKLRVGVFTHDGLMRPSPAVARAVREAADMLRAAGACVTEWEPPDLRQAEALYVRLLTANGAPVFRAALAHDKPEPQLALLYWLAQRSPQMVRRIRRILAAMRQANFTRQLDNIGFTAEDIPRLASEAEAYRRTFAAAMDRADGGPLDLVLSPACFSPAWPHGASRELITGGAYCIVYNLLGYPAGVVPVTRVRREEAIARPLSPDIVDMAARRVDIGSAGLPVGVQMAARPWQEHVALAAMKVIQDEARRRAGYPATPVA
ncbi:MAG: amidase family protein [Anaerolineae bacterium]|nr:amidase [Candidatus Roseilinea sp.]MDW8449931.1 amidase family protein [Anaerolineae bacterium]